MNVRFFRASIIKCLAAIVLILAALASPSQSVFSGKPWYITPAGNDAATCLAPADPCASINGVLTKPGFVPGEMINVAAGVYTGTGAQVALFDKDAVVVGGWDLTFKRQAGRSVLDGENARRGILINDNVHVLISQFNVRRGAADHGAGIYSRGNLVIVDGSVYDNTGEGIHIAGDAAQVRQFTMNRVFIDHNEGSGLHLSGVTITLNASLLNSAITRNHAPSGAGVLVDETGASITNTTISGNSADDGGGGIAMMARNHPLPSVYLNNVTITANTARQGGGIYFYAWNMLPVEPRNTLIAENQAAEGADCYGTGVLSKGHNLLGVTCGANSAPSDLLDADPLLGLPGGAPAYYPLLSGSPALDAGDPGGCKDEVGTALKTDQRGKPRFGPCDIGAFELHPLDFSTMSAAPAVLKPGQTVEYTLSLHNPLGAGITGVTLTNTLPAGLAYTPGSLTATGGIASSHEGEITWSGDLPTGSEITIRYRAVPTGNPGQITNTAALSCAGTSWEFPSQVLVYDSKIHLPMMRKQ